MSSKRVWLWLKLMYQQNEEKNKKTWKRSGKGNARREFQCGPALHSFYIGQEHINLGTNHSAPNLLQTNQDRTNKQEKILLSEAANVLNLFHEMTTFSRTFLVQKFSEFSFRHSP